MNKLITDLYSIDGIDIDFGKENHCTKPADKKRIESKK